MGSIPFHCNFSISKTVGACEMVWNEFSEAEYGV